MIQKIGSIKTGHLGVEGDETIRLTQKKIAELFNLQRPTITKHLKNVFENEELDGKVASSTFWNIPLGTV